MGQKTYLKKALFNLLSYRQINTLRKIKWMFLNFFVDDIKEIKKFYTTEIEIKLLEHILPVFCKNSVEPTIMDIGANIGGYSYYLAPMIEKQNGKCIAFEPGSKTYKRLIQNVICNSFVPEHMAISNSNGFLNLYLPTSHGCSSFVYRPEFEGLKTEEVAVCKLDDYVKNNKLDNICFIKIDVEGHEIEVIEGAIQAIQQYHPILLCESENRHISHTGKSTQLFIELITKMKYKGYVISKDTFEILSVNDIIIPENKNSMETYFYNYWFFPEHLDKKLVIFIHNYLKQLKNRKRISSV